ncbi:MULTISPECIES: DUF1566 domain-containing protein [Methylomonas]|nr:MULTISPECIES: DUF1566 domain-containing protein [Methylomonas]TCV73864.1 uncharacterized protein DUF1566 [Methylomonas methanica]
MELQFCKIIKVLILIIGLFSLSLTAQARDSLESLRNDLNTAVTKINVLQSQNAAQQIQLNSLQAQFDELAPLPVYKIGDIGPAGGFVFYLSDVSGMHGLEAALSDQIDAPWGCNGQIINFGNSAIYYTGKENTVAILGRCNELGIAAQVADAYSQNGFDDWYLPSKTELDFMFNNIGRGAAAPLTNVGGFALGYYWSSSEFDFTNAWSQGFSTGNESIRPKLEVRKVRAIRSF